MLKFIHNFADSQYAVTHIIKKNQQLCTLKIKKLKFQVFQNKICINYFQPFHTHIIVH